MIIIQTKQFSIQVHWSIQTDAEVHRYCTCCISKLSQGLTEHRHSTFFVSSYEAIAGDHHGCLLLFFCSETRKLDFLIANTFFILDAGVLN